MKNQIKTWVETGRGNRFEILLPAKRIVCPRCEGRGMHDHPAFSNGVDLDCPDFSESYFRGDYDVRCEECEGENVVSVVDTDALTPKMAGRYWRAVESREAHLAEVAAERRYFERASGGC